MRNFQTLLIVITSNLIVLFVVFASQYFLQTATASSIPLSSDIDNFTSMSELTSTFQASSSSNRIAVAVDSSSVRAYDLKVKDWVYQSLKVRGSDYIKVTDCIAVVAGSSSAYAYSVITSEWHYVDVAVKGPNFIKATGCMALVADSSSARAFDGFTGNWKSEWLNPQVIEVSN